MSHSLTLTGKVQRLRKNRDTGGKVAIVKDSHSYTVFVIPDKGYVVGQEVNFTGRIVETERGSGYIRLLPINER